MRLCSNTKHLGHLSKITASPHAIFAFWPDPRARVHATSRSMAPGGPWCGWSQNDLTPQMHQIYTKKCHFRSLLNDVVDLLHKRHKRWRCASCWAGSCTEGPSAFSSHVWKFETAPWLEIENTSQNLEWCMGSKHLAIVNAVKCLSPHNDSMFSYFSSMLIIHTYHP